ncbi:uncharacterized protein AB9W97_014176 isoform 2-T3 [Spinachia spinachia]
MTGQRTTDSQALNTQDGNTEAEMERCNGEEGGECPRQMKDWAGHSHVVCLHFAPSGTEGRKMWEGHTAAHKSQTRPKMGLFGGSGPTEPHLAAAMARNLETRPIACWLMKRSRGGSRKGAWKPGGWLVAQDRTSSYSQLYHRRPSKCRLQHQQSSDWTTVTHELPKAAAQSQEPNSRHAAAPAERRGVIRESDDNVNKSPLRAMKTDGATRRH